MRVEWASNVAGGENILAFSASDNTIVRERGAGGGSDSGAGDAQEADGSLDVSVEVAAAVEQGQALNQLFDFIQGKRRARVHLFARCAQLAQEHNNAAAAAADAVVALESAAAHLGLRVQSIQARIDANNKAELFSGLGLLGKEASEFLYERNAARVAAKEARQALTAQQPQLTATAVMEADKQLEHNDRLQLAAEKDAARNEVAEELYNVESICI
jgi:hypothetical protein